MSGSLLKAAIVSVALAISGTAYAANPMVGGAPMYASKTIVENATNAKNLTTLVAAVKAAGLVKTLEGPGPFTVFAPTNKAFAKLPKGTVKSLLKPENKKKLVKILEAHVVAGKLTAKDLVSDIKKHGGKYNMTTVSGDALTAELRGQHVYIIDESSGAAEVITPDVMQSNGVVHVVNAVLLPK